MSPLLRALLRGALGFAAVSVAAFSVWAFGGKWFKTHGGEPAMYVVIAGVFIGLSGLLLHPLARSFVRFYIVFVPAFLAYAAAWCAAWIALKYGWGEWLGSLGGSVAFALVAGALLKNLRPFLKVALALFVSHSAGYFLGELIWNQLHHSTSGMLLWGALYGLSFGSGIGFSLLAFRPPAKTFNAIPPAGAA